MSATEAEPDQLDPEEPHTPFWLTLLGGALFLAGAIFLLATAGGDAAEGAIQGDETDPPGAAPEPEAAAHGAPAED